MKQRSISVALVCLVVGAFASGTAWADSKTAKQIERKNREAMENYDLLDYEAAKKSLNEALALAKRKQMDQDPITAQAHLYLGIVELSGFGDKESALLQFMDAVAIDAKVEIPAAYKTGELSEMLDKARAEVGARAGGGGGEAAAGDELPDVDCASLMGMSHELVDEAKAGVDRRLDAFVAADVKADKVGLYYRAQGKNSFVEVVMDKSGDCHYAGVIPGDVLAGEFLHYYIAAKSADDKILASKGSAGSPNIIEIHVAAAGGGDAGFDEGGGALDEENPFEARKRRQRTTTTTTTAAASSSSSGAGAVSGAVDAGPSESKFFLSFALGSGGGYVTGKTESTQQDVGCCFAPALFHVFPELGYLLDSRTSISAAFRVGFPIGANIAGHSTGAPAGLVRYRRALSEQGEGIAISGGIGGGVLRNTVKLAAEAVPGQGMDTDTVALGPLLLSAGAAYTSKLGGPMKFIFEINAIAGLPVIDELGDCSAGSATCVRPQFGVQVDLNLGIMFGF